MAPTKTAASSKTKKAAQSSKTSKSSKSKTSKKATSSLNKSASTTPRRTRGVGGRFVKASATVGDTEQQPQENREIGFTVRQASRASTDERTSDGEPQASAISESPRPPAPTSTGQDGHSIGATKLGNSDMSAPKARENPSPPSAQAPTGVDVGETGPNTHKARKDRPPVQKPGRDPNRPLLVEGQPNIGKKRGKKRPIACLPKLPFPPAEAARRRMEWKQRWTEKPYKPVLLEEKLRSEFWWTSSAMPRCYSCKVQGAMLPSGDDAPDGTEDRDLLPCGCLYDAALLELWAVKKGLFIDAEWERKDRESRGEWTEHIGPKAFGKHKLLLLRFWEMLFGRFDAEVMFNKRGLREAMMRVFCDKEDEGEFKLAPNNGYVIHMSREQIGKRKRKASGNPTHSKKRAKSFAPRANEEEESDDVEDPPSEESESDE